MDHVTYLYGPMMNVAFAFSIKTKKVLLGVKVLHHMRRPIANACSQKSKFKRNQRREGALVPGS